MQLSSSSGTPSKTLPSDPVEFCRDWLFYDPYPYMWPFLRDESHFIANLQARQTGKTFNGMAKLLYLAFRHPGSLILVTAPKYDQVTHIAFKILNEHLKRLEANDPDFFEYVIGRKNLLRTVIRFRNGSTILAESAVPETIRGHTAKVVYLMECNFIKDDQDLYTAVLFTLNTTNGTLIAESTPWNTDSVFYRIFHDPTYKQFSTHTVTYQQALPPNGPLNQKVVTMIEQQLAGDPARWKREMLCEWTEDQNAWLPTSLITLTQDSQLEYQKTTKPRHGDFYIGVDFGKHIDHSVVTVLERTQNHLHLIHLKQFPLETSYGSVIGYIKYTQDNWTTTHATYADKTGVGEYIIEDMTKGGLRNVTGVNFTDAAKEAMATALKEKMRRVECPNCGWTGHVDPTEDTWLTTCIRCKDPEGDKVNLRPLLHIPYDKNLFTELNLERYEMTKTGKLLFNHPQGTHDDRFWALALAVYAAENSNPPSRPLAKII